MSGDQHLTTSDASGAIEYQLPMFIVDAFTDRQFTGNPAAVCLVGYDQVRAWFFHTGNPPIGGGERNAAPSTANLPRLNDIVTAHHFPVPRITERRI